MTDDDEYDFEIEGYSQNFASQFSTFNLRSDVLDLIYSDFLSFLFTVNPSYLLFSFSHLFSVDPMLECFVKIPNIRKRNISHQQEVQVIVLPSKGCTVH